MFRILITPIIIFVVAATLLGQQTEALPAIADTSTSSELQSQLDIVKADAALDDVARAKVIDAYTQAIAAAKTTATFLSKAAEFKSKTSKVESEVKELTAKAARPAESQQVDGTKSLKEMDSIVQQKTAQLESTRRDVDACIQAITAREQRLLEIPKAVAAANARLSTLDPEPTSESEETSAKVAAALAELEKQRQAQIKSEIDALKAENAWHLASGELLQLQREAAKRRQGAVQVELDKWEAAAREKREDEVDRDLRKAEQYLELLKDPRKHLEDTRDWESIQALTPLAENEKTAFARQMESMQAMATLAEQNEKTAFHREATETKLRKETSAQERLQKLYQKLQQQYDRAKKEAEAQSTITQSLGEVLREKRAELRNLGDVMPNRDSLSQQVSETRLQLYLLREEEAEYEDIDAATARLMDELDLDAGIRAEAEEQLEFRKSLVKGLRTDTEALFQVLARMEGTNASLATLSKEYANFIDERVLWIQSADFYGVSQAKQTVSSTLGLMNPSNWLGIPSEMLTGLKRRPAVPIVGGLLLIPFFLLGFRMRRALREFGKKAESGSCRDFGLTIRASLLTLGISIAWPVLLYSIGFWMKSSVAVTTGLIPALGIGLQSAAIAFFPLELFRQSARSNGLMVSHFRIAPSVASAIRSDLRWLAPVLVPLIAVGAAITALGNPIHEQSLGRFVFVLAMLVVACFLFRLGHPKSGATQVYFARRSDSLLFKSRYALFFLLVAVPIALATLALVGYHFTATQLSARLSSTCFLLLTLWFVHSLALRWVVLSRRRLAIEQVRARLAKTSEQTDTGPGSAEAQANLEEIDLASVDLQTRRLVRALTVVIGVFATWSLWADVLPALSQIGEQQAWEVSVPATVASDSTDSGESKLVAMMKTESVTYGKVAKAIAILVAMLLAMRDVPGLLELVLLQRLPLDVALRFAITTLTRYVIFVIGMAWALSTIEIGWSKVQWLVAGVSVGLGFGLQEIFANFVSGLIILFERPLRSGDIVTIDGVTGTVKSVRMRATIIQDLDRKDFVVPNKDFITGRLLNWTLSDEVSRIVLRVGVAYGSDTDEAKELMLAAAAEHEQISKDPPPQVIFEEFGDSSLNLTLRCFISLQNMPSRLSIIDQLHSKIDRSFRDAKIEIPFPQRDLHLRSSDVGLPRVESDEIDAREGKERL